MIFIRKCPKCGNEISYTRKWNRNNAEKENTNCQSCSAIGRIFSEKTKRKLKQNSARYWKGKKREPFSDNWKQKISESRKGKKWSEEIRRKISLSKMGDKNPTKRPEVRKKLRLAALKRNGIAFPNYNPIGCDIINWFNMYYDFNFQHAENGGEKCIDGYWPDGIDEKRKTIIEIDEPRHFDGDGKLREKDVERQNYLENLGYKFIRIKI